MSEEGWRDYVRNTRASPPRPLTVKALPFVHARNKALDLGSGALNDTRYLLEQGFRHVTAVDKFAVAGEAAARLPESRFQYDIRPMENYVFDQESYDLITAQFALPFIQPEHFSRTFTAIVNALVPQGILSANFFGDRDEWHENPQMTFLDSAEIAELLSAFTVHHFHEEEMEGPLASGEMKHWHIFHFIGEKQRSAIPQSR